MYYLFYSSSYTSVVLLIRMSLKQLVFKSTYTPVDETKLTPHFARDLIIDEVVISPVYSDSKLTKDTN